MHAALEALYAQYNSRAYADPDPIIAVYRYVEPADQEVVAFVAAALAFGNVKYILRSIDLVLAQLPHPHEDLQRLTHRQLSRRLDGFRHRYVGAPEMADLLRGMGAVLRRHGSLEACCAAHLKTEDDTVLPALGGLFAELRQGSALPRNYLLPDPGRGSAAKRLMMFARWMVRRDAVDLGLWTQVPAAKLVIPMDTHMGQMARVLGLTARKGNDLKAALEVTAAFRGVAPDDPTRYDFALTRLGIRRESKVAFLEACGVD
jgi:uncharacterized protein (TIGR02757 family)